MVNFSTHHESKYEPLEQHDLLRVEVGTVEPRVGNALVKQDRNRAQNV